MAKPKLTKWFPASVKPARVGWYEVRQIGAKSFARWDGKQWITTRWAMWVGWGDVWRGLASDPRSRA